MKETIGYVKLLSLLYFNLIRNLCYFSINPSGCLISMVEHGSHIGNVLLLYVITHFGIINNYRTGESIKI